MQSLFVKPDLHLLTWILNDNGFSHIDSGHISRFFLIYVMNEWTGKERKWLVIAFIPKKEKLWTVYEREKEKLWTMYALTLF